MHAPSWDDEADVIVVGLGAAGTVAAIEAADHGARVIALDRWGRGGASARSGGIIYAGGGTAQQRAAGFDDDPDQMEQYLSLEEGTTNDEVLRRFCDHSLENLTWLESLGVTIPDAFDPTKTVTPTDDEVGLYFSGNEKHYAATTPAAPRGHRVAGAGMTGHDLMAALTDAARTRGVDRRTGSRLMELVVDDDGRVTGVDVLVLASDRRTRIGHYLLFRLADACGPMLRRVPRLVRSATDRFEQRRGRRLRIRADRGVILCTGGFSFNHEMVVEHAPDFAGAMPLGTPGDDGSGIELARRLGASTRLMEHCGASRFLAPPTAFSWGLLVDADGERVCDESMYAATLSARIAEHGGRAWLIVDQAIRDQVRDQIRQATWVRGRPLTQILSGRANHVLFPQVFGSINLYLNRTLAADLDDLAHRCGIAADGLRATVERYNATAWTGGPDDQGKPADLLRPIATPPFAAIPCHLDGVLFPAPCITLGGLDVDPHTQQVRRVDGSAIAGLYAAGRCAAGVASNSYVSGLSLADCVFSGRNAGRAVTSPAPAVTSPAPAVTSPAPAVTSRLAHD